MRIRRTLVMLSIPACLVLGALPVAAQEQIDLVVAFPEALTTLAGEGTDPFAWSTVPEAATAFDGADDLFTLAGDAQTSAPPYVDLVQSSQFGFEYPRAVFRMLFGNGGPLDCGRPEVSCPRYDTETDPFADGAFVVGFQLAAVPEPSGPEAFTVAILAHDDDFPTFQDPRPASPFVGTNKAWRFDLSAQADAVSFLQVAGGTYQEFHTDARVLLEGDHGWVLIPAAEFPLESTIDGQRAHTYWVASPEAPPEDEAADVDGEGTSPTLTTPVGQTGELELAAAEPPAESPTPTPTRSPPSETPAAGGEASAAEEGDRITPLVLILIIGGLIAMVIGLFLLWPWIRCWKEYQAWRTAQRVCSAADTAAERARAEADAAREELDALRKEYPPLGFDQSDVPSIEMDTGDRMSALDQALLNWAMPPVSLGEGGSRSDVQARTMQQLRRLREQHKQMKAREAELVANLAEAEKAAADAKARAEDACAKAEEAHQAYLRCMGAAPAPAPAAGGPPPPEGEGPRPPEGGQHRRRSRRSPSPRSPSRPSQRSPSRRSPGRPSPRSRSRRDLSRRPAAAARSFPVSVWTGTTGNPTSGRS